MKNAVLTGTSSGIGYALAKALLRRGYRVFGSVRRPEDAERLQRELGPQFTPLLFDVTDEAAVQAAARQVALALGDQGLDALVNNAGIAVTGPLMHLPLNELRQQLAVNVVGVVAVTQAFLPLLGAAPNAAVPAGHIYNMGSIASTLSVPFSGPYGASKRGLTALTESWRVELLPFGIGVTLFCPGVVATATRQDLDPERYAATRYAPAMRRAQAILQRQVRRGWDVGALAERLATAIDRREARWTLPLVKGRLLNWTIPRRLPPRLVAWAVGRVLGLKR